MYFIGNGVFFQITSEAIVLAYIERIKEVNPLINAVVQDRFEEAIEEAKHADYIAGTTSIASLEKDYPILGVPFTVKESCKLGGRQTTNTHKNAEIIKIFITFTNSLEMMCNFIYIFLLVLFDRTCSKLPFSGDLRQLVGYFPLRKIQSKITIESVFIVYLRCFCASLNDF